MRLLQLARHEFLPFPSLAVPEAAQSQQIVTANQ